MIKITANINHSNIDIYEVEGIRICNTTPHKLNLLSEKTGYEYEIKPSGFILNAKTEEIILQNEPVKIVQTKFIPDEKSINMIYSIINYIICKNTVIIVGSMIATKTYDNVVGLTPVKGFERVKPSEKKMNLFKFRK